MTENIRTVELYPADIPPLHIPKLADHSMVKFRPVLTLEQIKYLASILQFDSSIENSIRRVLIPLIAKVEVGAISPAYKLSESHTKKMLDSMMQKKYENGEMSAEEEAIYESKILGI